MTLRHSIVIAALAIASGARADTPESTPAPEEAPAADAPPTAAATAPVSPDYDPIPDEAKLESLWQRVDELYARAEEKLAQLNPPAPQR